MITRSYQQIVERSNARTVARNATRNLYQPDMGDFRRDDLLRNPHTPEENSFTVDFKKDGVLRKPHHARNSYQADMGDFRKEDLLRKQHTPERKSSQADFKRDEVTRNSYHADKGDFEGEL